MKIIFLTEMGRAIGGGGYAQFKFAQELALMGHDIQIFGINSNNSFLKGTDIPPNLRMSDRIHLLRRFRGAGRIDEILYKLYSFFVVKKSTSNSDYDYICGLLRRLAITASELVKHNKNQMKCVNFVYETPPWMEHDLGERWFEEYKGRFKKSWERTKQAYLDSDILISNSKMSQSWCEKWLEDKKVNDYVYPGINTKEVDSIEVDKTNQHIIYVGRLNIYKNIDLVIRALADVNNPPLFLVVGYGSQYCHLKKLAETLKVNCKFLGAVSDSDKWKLIKESLFMVFPSSHEGFGMPPMEALACEKPCICSDKPIFKEVYGNKVEYSKENNVDDLRKKMEFLIKNPEYRKKRGKEGRKYVEKKFSWRKSAEKIERILQENLKNDRKSSQ